MSTLKVATIKHSDGTTTSEPSIPALDNRMTSAWCHLNSAFTILGSYNVSSITDNGTGDGSVNFTTAMSNDDYSAQFTVLAASSARTAYAYNTHSNTQVRFRIITAGSTVTLVDEAVALTVSGGK